MTHTTTHEVRTHVDESDIDRELKKMYRMLYNSKMLRTALRHGEKVDVVLNVNDGQVQERGPFVRMV